MPANLVSLTGIERTFHPDEIIVSKTDTKGRITYANRLFQKISGYDERELLGKAHNIVRHPHMPRCIFKFLWDTIAAGDECFAYVLNRCKNGDHYWVLAHVTPTRDENGRILGYHSNRRSPSRSAIDTVSHMYRKLLDIEHRHSKPADQWAASLPAFQAMLNDAKLPYDEFIFTLV